jgi:hypothetical protein|tara:strand:- start:1210 stop:1428 length:219 start_codon:yes stop_codon:yes gene_type:complete
MSESQNKAILEYLKKGKTITPLEALPKFGCLRLSARIFNLREAGHHIITNRITRGDKTFAEYTLIKENHDVR